MLSALTVFGRKGLTMRHVKVLLGVELMVKVTKGKGYPTAKKIGQLIGVPCEEFERELRELVEDRYLHEMHPTFGELIMTYKLGSLGGTVMRYVRPLLLTRPGGEPVE